MDAVREGYLRSLFSPGYSIQVWVCFIAPLLTLVYLPLARKARGHTWLCHGFVIAFWMLLWFGYWVVDWSSARYGVILSMVAGGVLLLGAVGEARALTGQSWLRTGGQLLIGRLPPPLGQGQCPRCGYLLYGLTENRCPECGRGYTVEEVGLSAEEFASAILGSSAPSI
ncbi:MAG: hypothetical protein KA354_19665 [Phycisphaerae bacterium]|nr:hypothetical protein [Phycisphaerae bacterium]